jgi:hypothetical protein
MRPSSATTSRMVPRTVRLPWVLTLVMGRVLTSSSGVVRAADMAPARAPQSTLSPGVRLSLLRLLRVESLEVLEGGVAENACGEVAEQGGGVARIKADEAVSLEDLEEHLPGTAFGGAGLEALGDELLGDHDGGGCDVAAGAGERGHEEGREVRAEERLGELAGAEVDGGAEDNGGEAERAVGAEDAEEDLPGGGPGHGGGSLEAGLDGVDGEQRGVGEGPRGGAGAGTDGGAGERGGSRGGSCCCGLGNGEGGGAEDGGGGEGVEEQGGEVGDDEGCLGLGSRHGGERRRRHLSLLFCLPGEVDSADATIAANGLRAGPFSTTHLVSYR